jgi:hypothetical protein
VTKAGVAVVTDIVSALETVAGMGGVVAQEGMP